MDKEYKDGLKSIGVGVTIVVALIFVGVTIGKIVSEPAPSPAKLPAAIPRFIYVNGARWETAPFHPDGENSMLGETDCKKRIIWYSDELRDPAQRENILHEVMHAEVCQPDGTVNNLFYNSTTPESHEGIYRIGATISTLLHDNPDLTRFLVGPE